MGLVTHVANTKPLQANKFHETSWSPAGVYEKEQSCPK